MSLENLLPLGKAGAVHVRTGIDGGCRTHRQVRGLTNMDHYERREGCVWKFL